LPKRELYAGLADWGNTDKVHSWSC
jgi:hypothetical protein